MSLFILTLPDSRSLLSQALPKGEGVMYAARCSAGAVSATIENLGVQAKVSVASVNGPKSVVIAGAEAEVAAVLAKLGGPVLPR